MFKVILKTSFFYYLVTFLIVLKCINFNVVHNLRAEYLGVVVSQNLAGSIVYYDYVTRLSYNNNASNWFKLARSYRMWGDYLDAEIAYHKALALSK